MLQPAAPPMASTMFYQAPLHHMAPTMFCPAPAFHTAHQTVKQPMLMSGPIGDKLVTHLPGIGHRYGHRLNEAGIYTVCYFNLYVLI